MLPPGVGAEDVPEAGAAVLPPGEGAPVPEAGAAVLPPAVGPDVAGRGAAETGADVAPGVGLCEFFGTCDGAVVAEPVGATVGGHLICSLLLLSFDLLGRPLPLP